MSTSDRSSMAAANNATAVVVNSRFRDRTIGLPASSSAPTRSR
ncbi:hypothetical protein ABZ816_25800 [Actinosynnema sp. NPDC047251]|nr:hypothetical protein [Saccharothrix espanaensis]